MERQQHISNNNNYKQFINFDFQNENKNTIDFKDILNYVSNNNSHENKDINKIIYEYLQNKYLKNGNIYFDNNINSSDNNDNH